MFCAVNFIDRSFVDFTDCCSNSVHPKVSTQAKELDGLIPSCHKDINIFYLRNDGSGNICGSTSPCSTFSSALSLISSSSDFCTIFLMGVTFSDSSVVISERIDVLIQSVEQDFTLSYAVGVDDNNSPLFTINVGSLLVVNLTINFDSSFHGPFVALEGNCFCIILFEYYLSLHYFSLFFLVSSYVRLEFCIISSVNLTSVAGVNFIQGLGSVVYLLSCTFGPLNLTGTNVSLISIGSVSSTFILDVNFTDITSNSSGPVIQKHTIEQQQTIGLARYNSFVNLTDVKISNITVFFFLFMSIKIYFFILFFLRF
jgi:hypothetical protein